MKRIVTLTAVLSTAFLLALMATSCSKQCECQKITHYADYSTSQSYTQTIDGESTCSSLSGEFFTEDAYGNPIYVDVISCHEAY